MRKILSLFMAFLLIFSSSVMAYATDEEKDKKAILSALYEADISTVREAIDLKIISCEELTSYYLERIEKYNEEYNCFITMCDDALSVAKQRDETLRQGESEGVLFGIPVVVKDNIDVEGLYTTNGHSYESSKIAKKNAPAVDYLLEQGAVIIGKTNMSTDAQDARTSYSKIKGETKNAYNTLLVAGGSSGGSAVAVSLNFALAGLGTDTNSSLRIPAVLNGCVSLRATYNLIDRTGFTMLNGSRDVLGAITRTVYDQAIMMDVLTHGEYAYTKNLDDNALDGLKIGILEELSYATTSASVTGDEEKRNTIAKKFDLFYRTEKHIDGEVASAFENAVTELESCGVEITTVSMPRLWNLSFTTFSGSDLSFKQALYDEFRELLEENDLDAVIFPSYLSTPLKSGTDENGKNWNVWSQPFINNCRVLSPSASLPEISIPIGYHSSGAGIGLEIASLKNSEQMLLNIAYSYSQKYNHRTVPTGTPDTYSEYSDGTLKEIIDNFVLSVNAESETSSTTEAPTVTEPITEQIVTDKPQNKASRVVPTLMGVAFVGAGVIISVIAKKTKRKKKKEKIEEIHYDKNVQ